MFLQVDIFISTRKNRENLELACVGTKNSKLLTEIKSVQKRILSHYKHKVNEKKLFSLHFRITNIRQSQAYRVISLPIKLFSF